MTDSQIASDREPARVATWRGAGRSGSACRVGVGKSTWATAGADAVGDGTGAGASVGGGAAAGAVGALVGRGVGTTMETGVGVGSYTIVTVMQAEYSRSPA